MNYIDFQAFLFVPKCIFKHKKE